MMRRFLSDLVGNDCAFCGAPAVDVLCQRCDNAVPRLEIACARCAAVLPAPGVCGRCLGSPPAFDRAAAALQYCFPVDRLVHRFKFQGDFAMGTWLGTQLARRVEGMPRPKLLVAPPLGARRLRERGFNQSVELARTVGSALGIAVDPFIVCRVRDTVAQRGLDAEERRRNLAGAFECRGTVRGLHVGVIDDVITTGATVDAVAAALKGAGAQAVSIWAAARTP
ncbi:MAG TPA: ComF family protein [Usitatibacter sp.]|nr:ComF family protein [Usitatibacter sp.]